MEIKVNLNPLKETTVFLYRGITIIYSNSDWAVLCRNLQTCQRRWGTVEKVMRKIGEPIKGQEMMYKAVVQAVILYGRKIWVATDAMMMVLEEFHQRTARRIAGTTVMKGDGA